MSRSDLAQLSVGPCAVNLYRAATRIRFKHGPNRIGGKLIGWYVHIGKVVLGVKWRWA